MADVRKAAVTVMQAPVMIAEVFIAPSKAVFL